MRKLLNENFKKVLRKEAVLWLALLICLTYVVSNLIRSPLFRDHHPVFEKSAAQLSSGWEYAWDNPRIENGKPVEGTLPPSEGWKPLGKPVNPPDRGDSQYVWFRYQLPQKTWKSPAVFIEATDVSFVAYVDGQPLHFWGKMGADSRKEFAPWVWRIIDLPQNSEGKHLYLLMYSDLSKIGITGVPVLGARDNLVANLYEKSIWRLFVGGLCVFLGAVALLLFILKPTQRPLLSYSVFSISTGAINLFDHYVPYFVANFHVDQNLIIPGMVMAPVALLFYLRQVFQIGKSKLVNTVLWFNCGVLAYTLFRHHLDLDTLPFLFGPFQFAVLFSMVVIFAKVVPPALKGNPDAKLFFGGLAVWMLWIKFDILSALNLLPWSVMRSNFWGLLIFNLSLVAILGRRFAAVHNQLQEFSQALERTNRRLHTVLEISQKMTVAREIPDVVQFTLASLATEFRTRDNSIQARVEITGESPVIFKHEIAEKQDNSSEKENESFAQTVTSQKQTLKFDGGQLSAALSSGEHSWGRFVLEGLDVESFGHDDIDFLTTVLQSLTLAFDNIMATREKIRAELKVSEARLEELGGVAVYLGDRVANPMAILNLSAEEINELAHEAENPDLGSELSEHCTRMVNAIQRMKDEFQVLAKYKSYARGDVVHNMFPEVEGGAGASPGIVKLGA